MFDKVDSGIIENRLMHDSASSPHSQSDTSAQEGDSGKPWIVVAGLSGLSDDIHKALPPQLYGIDGASTASELRDLLTKRKYDLIFLNTEFSDMDGISVIQWLSSANNAPYLIVRSETDDELDRVLAIELGADDCVPLSCSLREIKARVRALFRRRLKEQRDGDYALAERSALSGPKLESSGWILNKDKRQLFTPTGASISLTNAEYSILTSLFSEPGVVKDRLSLRGFDVDEVEADDDRSLGVFVSRLRKKLARYGGQGLIETVRGRGYRLSQS
jgi:DNA-binding response OmpR family regulator